MRAAPAQALPSPLIARKSQQIVIAIALIAPIDGARSNRPQGSRIEVNSALITSAGHFVAEHMAAAQGLVWNLRVVLP